jgi:hypothetical protein
MPALGCRLADVLRGTSGFTLVGSGTHQVDRPIRFEGASFLKITGDFTVSAAERRDNWQHQGWDNDELPDAVLYKNCPYLSIPRTVEVVGAKSWYRDYNPAQTYEMGRLRNSPVPVPSLVYRGYRPSLFHLGHLFRFG